MEMRNVCLLGSTGSIGRAGLEIVEHLNDQFGVFAISCHRNTELFRHQIEQFKPKYACITDPDSARGFEPIEGTTMSDGVRGSCEIASHPDVDIVLNGIVGAEGVHATLAAIRSNKIVAMANKETLIAYGDVLRQELEQSSATILPVDSEHSAIYQCISGSSSAVKRIILTASGGPFLRKPMSPDVTCVDALKHPVWQMGQKITIDCATLMNKGLEVIEACFLFDVTPETVEVVIHPQSIVHSAVEFVDGAVIAQLSLPDMRLAIQYGLTYPERCPSLIKPLELAEIGRLDFEKPDFEKFKCLTLAYEAANKGGTMPCVLNAADQVAVNAFLSEKIKLTDIPDMVEKVMAGHSVKTSPSLADIETAEKWATEETEAEVQRLCC
jgi:1-deoxy-D-xylulose-5-phosphate reductoisomerase